MPATSPLSRRAARRDRERQAAAERLAAVRAAGTGWVPAPPTRPLPPPDRSPADQLVDSLRTDPEEPGRRGARHRMDAGSPGPPGGGRDGWQARLADRLPPTVRGARWAVPLTAVVALLAITGLVGMAMAVRTAAATPGVPVPARSVSATPSADVPDGERAAAQAGSAPAAGETGGELGAMNGGTSGPAATGSPGGQVVAHVVGQVRQPGLVRLPPGARVDDALTAAGGPTGDADLARVNLARPVVDGEQVVVPKPGEPMPESAPASAAGDPSAAGAVGEATGAPVNLNSASGPQLEELPGVGPVLAGRILQWRADNGRFSTVDELGEVSGIGPKVLERLRPLVTV